MEQDRFTNILEPLFQETYPKGKGLERLRLTHSSFCNALADNILNIDRSIKVKVLDEDFFCFEDIREVFFGVEIQAKKIVLAPLRLEAADLEGIDCVYRDISSKSYKFGGVIRVDMRNFDQKDLEVAQKLAVLSFQSRKEKRKGLFKTD